MYDDDVLPNMAVRMPQGPAVEITQRIDTTTHIFTRLRHGMGVSRACSFLGQQASVGLASIGLL